MSLIRPFQSLSLTFVTQKIGFFVAPKEAVPFPQTPLFQFSLAKTPPPRHLVYTLGLRPLRVFSQSPPLKPLFSAVSVLGFYSHSPPSSKCFLPYVPNIIQGSYPPSPLLGQDPLVGFGFSSVIWPFFHRRIHPCGFSRPPPFPNTFVFF